MFTFIVAALQLTTLLALNTLKFASHTKIIFNLPKDVVFIFNFTKHLAIVIAIFSDSILIYFIAMWLAGKI